MKKFLTFFSIAALAFVLVTPVFAAQLQLPTPPPTSSQGLTGSGIVNIITTIVNYGITLAVIVAVAMFIWGGVQYATGNKEAKTILTNAAIGLLAILGVGLLINTIAGLVQRGLNVG